MTILKSIRKLKIVEQIILVMLFAVLVPMTIIGFIINNVNQQSVRAQLNNTAILVANTVSEGIEVFQNSINYELQQIAMTLDYFDTYQERINYLKKVEKNAQLYKRLRIVSSKSEYLKLKEQYAQRNEAVLATKMKNGNYLLATFNIEKIKSTVFVPIGKDQRQIYVLNNKQHLMTAYNYDSHVLSTALKQLPKEFRNDEAIIYGEIKNQPFVYLKKTNPDILIIVSTPRAITKTYIDYSRFKIILSVLIASFAVWIMVGLYTSYLYINIRQLFKAIIALSKGNYKRRIRLLTHLFTPYEIIFLANEFNRMANQINKSYKKLEKNNKELHELNEFRSNMIDTVSHEFRTPLTSIQGYTSRLLRQDIQIDEGTKIKSLKTIKRQTERLKRMVEDLLVIPDIEGSKIVMNFEKTDIYDTVEASMILGNNSNKTIINKIDKNIPNIIADKDRFEQVVINLIENAIKYSDEDTNIEISAEEFEDDYIKISIKNKCNMIPKDKLKTLFDKFTRLDDKTTRTTRGTGLGLYIVKGLIESMNGHINLHSGTEWGFEAQIFMKRA